MRTILLAVLVLAAPALAQTPPPAAAAATPAKPAKKDEKMKCHNERALGTMFSTRVCRTDDNEKADGDAAYNALQRPPQGIPPQ